MHFHWLKAFSLVEGALRFHWQGMPGGSGYSLAASCSPISALAGVNGDAWRPNAHFDLVRRAATAARVDDKTGLDLEFPEIFARFDTTITPLGRQYLFSRMRTYVEDPPDFAERYRCAEALRRDDVLRERIQLALTPLKDDGYADLVDVIFGDAPRAVKYPRLLLLWSAVGLLTPPATISSFLPPWVLLVTVVINVLIIVRTFGSLPRDSEALKRCLVMLPVAESLAWVGADCPKFAAMAQLRAPRPERKQFATTFRGFLRFQKESVQGVSIWLNVTFLLELVAYSKVLKHFGEMRSVFRSTWELLGEIDASVAVAGALEFSPVHCLPALSSAPLIDIKDGCHPLLAYPTRNSLWLDGRSALIAGSNMAGKTTMIEMVGGQHHPGPYVGFLRGRARGHSAVHGDGVDPPRAFG